MNTLSPTARKLLGLFELDPAGTVLYSKFEPDGEPRDPPPDAAGRNFYEEVAPFANVEEFRRRVSEFARGGSPADKFYFDCQYDGEETLPVRVLLARIREGSSGSPTKSVLIHIRKGS